LTLEDILNQAVSGLSRGMMLFLISSGLSFVFGVMNILNFAHATLWLLGGYFTFTFWSLSLTKTLNLWVSIPLAGLTMAAIGLVIERLLLKRVYERPLTEQLVLTFGLVLILGDLIKVFWGPSDKCVEMPPSMALGVYLFGGSVPTPLYRIFIIVVGGIVAVGLWGLLYGTTFGKKIRAAVYSRDMVRALGIGINRIYTGVFVLMAFIVGIAGGIEAPLSPIGLGKDTHIIIECFSVVVIGGLGSILGTLVGALIVGEIYSFAILVTPRLAMVLIFIITAIVLIFRPWGLFGSPLRKE
jgi:branched-chain amino acid transport system permease protein